MNLSMGQGTPGGLVPHTRGRLAPRYGARDPLGTILLINNRDSKWVTIHVETPRELIGDWTLRIIFDG